MKLPKGYYVKFDESNYELRRKRISTGTKSKGEEVDVLVGYYGRFYQLAKSILEHDIKVSAKEMRSMKQIEDNMNKFALDIKENISKEIELLKNENVEMRKELDVLKGNKKKKGRPKKS